MKKLLASVAVLAVLSACSQEPEAPAAPVEEVAAPAVTKESYIGQWNVTLADGSTHVTTNNPDGSFTRVMSDGTTDSGFWTFTAEQSCWTPEGGVETCYAIGPEDAAGKLTLTATDGTIVTATRIPAAAAAPAAVAPAAGAPAAEAPAAGAPAAEAPAAQ